MLSLIVRALLDKRLLAVVLVWEGNVIVNVLYTFILTNCYILSTLDSLNLWISLRAGGKIKGTKEQESIR